MIIDHASTVQCKSFTSNNDNDADDTDISAKTSAILVKPNGEEWTEKKTDMIIKIFNK